MQELSRQLHKALRTTPADGLQLALHLLNQHLMAGEDQDHLALPATGRNSKQPQVQSRASEGLLLPGLHKPEDTSPSSLDSVCCRPRLPWSVHLVRTCTSSPLLALKPWVPAISPSEKRHAQASLPALQTHFAPTQIQESLQPANVHEQSTLCF